MEIPRVKEIQQELIFGIRIHAEELVKKSDYKQMELTSLKRLDQIAKHIMREEMLQNLHADSDMKNIKVKVQKYYKEIDNHTEF